MKYRLKLYHKLFIAFTVTAILMVTTFSAIMHFMISRNFSEYVTQSELQRNNTLKNTFITYFKENGSWEGLEESRETWFLLLRNTIQRSEPSFKQRNDQSEFPPSNEQRRGFRRMGMGMGPGHRRMMGTLPRITLFDAQKRHIAGAHGPQMQFVFEELHFNKNLIGYIGLKKPPKLSSPVEMVFLKKQQKVIFIVGATIIVLASFIAWLISKQLLQQIFHLKSGTQKIASRKFDTRIAVQTNDELGALASSFNKMASTLEGYEKQQRQWISDVSHELGTPLSVLKGEIEAMQDGIRPMNDQQLYSLQEEVKHMEKIVIDLKFLSSSETGELRYEWEQLNPASIFSDILEQYRGQLEMKGLKIINHLAPDRIPFLKADQLRLKQVFMNLLENNLRYTDAPADLKVSSVVKDEQVFIYVEDEGPGVPKESLPKLFDRLYRVDGARNRAKGGSGLGLAISREIIEQHKGIIAASKSDSGGLKITIQLPIS